SSMPILPPDRIDIPYDYESVQQAGSMLGSGAIIVLDDSVNMVEMAWRLSKFYAHESCGQCTPCREGTKWLAQILTAIHEGRGDPSDIDTIHGLFDTEFSSICLLWSSVIMPVRALLKEYEEEFRAAIARGAPDLSHMGQPGTPVPVLTE
ncbi:MAG: NADH-ubiquinone oxidoreductase-F iron-sulfur binding region domain-containing protein, partial [bacterium]